MPASLLFYHHYFMALQHQVKNVLIITFLIPDFSQLPLLTWLWPLVLPRSSQPWTAVTSAIKGLFLGSHAERDVVISPAVCTL